MSGTLYVVSTPIGNLDDITVRALNTLKSVGLVAAEDTRRTGLLLRHFGVATPTTSFHAHNEAEKLPALLRRLAEGVDVALVSDAGSCRSLARAPCLRRWLYPGMPQTSSSSPALLRLGRKTENNGFSAGVRSFGRLFFLKRRIGSSKQSPRWLKYLVIDL